MSEHCHLWYDLAPEEQAAVDRAVAKAPPLTDEKARRLANLLGLRSTGTDPGSTAGGGDDDLAA